MLLPGESEYYISEGAAEGVARLMASLIATWPESAQGLKAALVPMHVDCVKNSIEPKFDMANFDEETADLEDAEVVHFYAVGRAQANKQVALAIADLLAAPIEVSSWRSDEQLCKFLISLDEELCLDALKNAKEPNLIDISERMLRF